MIILIFLFCISNMLYFGWIDNWTWIRFCGEWRNAATSYGTATSSAEWRFERWGGRV